MVSSRKVTSGDGDPDLGGDDSTNPSVSKENTFKEFYIKAESERSKSTNPSMEEIIGGIMQLIGNNVKLNKPLNKPQPLPSGLNEQELINQGLRLSTRNPSTFVNGLQLNQLPSVYHSSVLLGPPPPGMPLPLGPYNNGGNNHNKISKPPPYLPLSNTGKSSLRIPESNITGILDHKVKPQIINHHHQQQSHHQIAFDPLNRVPSNKILPKPLHPLSSITHDRDTTAGSQLHPEFTSPTVNSVNSASSPRPPYNLQVFSSSSDKHHSIPTRGSHLSSSSHPIGAVAPSPGDVPSVPVLHSSLPSTLIDHHSTSLSNDFTSFHSLPVETTHIPSATVTIHEDDESKEYQQPPASSNDHDASASSSSSSSSSTSDRDASHKKKHQHLNNNSKAQQSPPPPPQPPLITTSETDRENDSNITSDPSEWLPLGQASLLKPSKTWSEDPPIIITQEDPSVFDITIRHKIGANADTSFKVTVPSSSSSSQQIKVTKTQTMSTTSTLFHSSTPVIVDELNHHIQNTPPGYVSASSSALDAVTTTSHAKSSSTSQTNTPTTTSTSNNDSIGIMPTTVSIKSFVSSTPVPVDSSSSSVSDLFPTKSRKSSSIISKSKVDLLDDNDDDVHASSSSVSSIEDDDVVYGKPLEANRPIAPSIPDITLMGSGTLSTQKTPVNRPTVLIQKSHHIPPTASVSPVGKPFVIPVDVDEVKPKAGTALTPSQVVVTDPGQGSVYIDGRPTHFKIRPAPTLQVGSGVTVKTSPHDTSSGGRVLTIPRPLATSPSVSTSSASSSKSVRRPPFRLRPSVPLVRIDTCIVGDDSTCEVKMNEKCKTELGISSCQCRPGFGRSTARGMCNPIITLGVALKLDKLDEKKLSYNTKYANSNSEDYQFLEYECIQGFNSMFSLSRLSKVFMGIRVNRFFSAGGKMLVNASIDLELNNITKSPTIKRIVQQELSRVITLRNNNIGDSALWVDASSNSVPRVDDVNECLNNELNDCSSNAFCINEFGSFRCLCKKGFEDRWATDPKKSGRYCSSCSPSYCSNRGECHIVDGEKECKCRGNFIGSKCDIDVEGKLFNT